MSEDISRFGYMSKLKIKRNNKKETISPLLMARYTIHAITRNKWDLSLKPILTVRDGDEVKTKEASDGQITQSSSSQDLLKLDFSRIHPLTGPIEIEGAEPGDAIEIEFLEFRDMGRGWTGVIPGFGLFAQDPYTTPIDLAGPAIKIWSIKDGKARARFGMWMWKYQVCLPRRYRHRAILQWQVECHTS